MNETSIGFIGAAGIPNRYGGFESFLENCAPIIAKSSPVAVTCDANIYSDKTAYYRGVNRLFIKFSANGVSSIIHDFMAFFSVFFRCSDIVVLGVSGGIWFPFFRVLCDITGRKLYVNIDGVEWRRLKFSPPKRAILYIFDKLAQLFSHRIIYDNEGLQPFIWSVLRYKASMIPYSGDHANPIQEPFSNQTGTALTICRIEPENQIEMLIEAAIESEIDCYTIVGNWSSSGYGQSLQALYGSHPKLRLMAPIYDPTRLVELRKSNSIYLHGHSVGGTNPSLVEMLFYPVHLLTFDCSFNRFTAKDSARYFKDVGQLIKLINSCVRVAPPSAPCPNEYTAQNIASQYLSLTRRSH